MSPVLIDRVAAERLHQLAGGSPKRVEDLRMLLERAATDGGDDAIDLELIERLEPLLLEVADARWWGASVAAVSPEARAALIALAGFGKDAHVNTLAEALGKARTTVEMLVSGLSRDGLVHRREPGIVALADPTLQRYLQRMEEETTEAADSEE